MSQVRFGDHDRDRWGLDEWVEWDPMDISIADLTELSDRFSFDPSDWPHVFFGEIPLEQAGSPDAERVGPKWQLQAMVWMTLRQNNIDVSWEEAGAARVGRIRRRTAPSPGKDEAESTPSETSEPSTTPPSETS